jgi:DNA sulfur modification protein DndC
MAAEDKQSKISRSIFTADGFGPTVAAVKEEIRELYLWDKVPWVVGYSGGKDSSTVLQLVWTAVAELPPEKRHKPIHVISTDTLVEQPVVAMWVDASHEKMLAAAREQAMPVVPHKLTPEVKDTYWVNLIGKGYPAPRKLFRWCTDRLKIKPSNKFIREVVCASGEAILVLGTRKAESQRRGLTMDRHEKRRVRERLTPNAKLPNSLVYTPIEDWANDDVWLYLMQVKNPWGHDNKSLLTMYQGATSGGECPLVVDTSTPSCGSSRFGCWVCTLVDQDRSMEAMIANDEEKVWMTPLLELRNELGEPNDRARRDYRRIDGRVQLFHDSTVAGPYKRDWREHWLRRVLAAEEGYFWSRKTTVAASEARA